MYHRYGGRGIRVHPGWQGPGGFQAFLACVGPRPGPKYSLDRINNDGNYEPGNVRWATKREQSRNKSTNRRVTVNGETKCILDWASDTAITESGIRARLKRGWPADRAVTAAPEMEAGQLVPSKFLTINGVTKCITAWAREAPVSAQAITYRLRLGWPADRAVFEPPMPRVQRHWG